MLDWLARITPGRPLKLTIARAERRLSIALVPSTMTDEQFARWKELVELARKQRR